MTSRSSGKPRKTSKPLTLSKSTLRDLSAPKDAPVKGQFGDKGGGGVQTLACRTLGVICPTR
jgi:hypothetical protein